MKRILLILDTANAKTHALDFACFVARLTKSHLTILSLEPGMVEQPSDMTLATKMLFERQKVEDLATSPGHSPLYERNKKLISNACQSREANFSFYIVEAGDLSPIILETRFADMLIVDPEMTLSGSQEGAPTSFAKELLLKSECPVILAPYSFEGIDEILLAYDGSRSCVFAIRQFALLFPELANKKLTVLQVNGNDEDKLLAQQEKITQLLQTHFNTVDFELIKGVPASGLLQYLIGRQKTFVVLGAFGRNIVSNFFKESTAYKAIGTVNLPFFVSHC
ncbi:MAG: hypothetical protein ACTHLE_03090 [Agriterribacter sp.]